LKTFQEFYAHLEGSTGLKCRPRCSLFPHYFLSQR